MRIKIYPDSPNYKLLSQVTNALRNGEVVIYPTNTGYAYCCDALQARSVEKICSLKGIAPKKKSLSIMFLGLSEVSEYCKLSNPAFQFIKEHPGNYTYILPAGNNLPKIYKQRKEIGVRIAQHPVGKLILQELGNPLIVSSLPTDEDEPEYAQDPELIDERFASLVSYVIDGGITGTDGPSTVVDCTQEPFTILRD